MNPVDELQATRVSDIDVDARQMRKFDEVCVQLLKLRIGLLLIAVLLILVGGLLGDMWNWRIGAAHMVVAMLAMLLFFLLAKGMSGRIYKEGQLVPAVVVQLHPIELLALADMTIPGGSSRAHDAHWAYKRFRVKKLPRHQLRVGELVPCVTSFQRREDGVFADFLPRPLAWATGSEATIKRNIARIDENEWGLLKQFMSRRTCIEEGAVRIEVEPTDDRGVAVWRKCRFYCIGFNYPIDWLVEVEDLGDGAYYVACEQEGDDATALVVVTAVSHGDAPAELLQRNLGKLREQPSHEALDVRETGTINYRGYSAHYCTFTLETVEFMLYGRIYTFSAGDYSMTVMMQDKEDRFDEKFAFMKNSLQVLGSAPAKR